MPSLDALATGEDYNLIIFSHSALNRDRLCFYGGSSEVDPEAKRYFSHGLVFDQHFAVSHWPFQSIVSALTGLLPTSHRVWNNGFHNRIHYKNLGLSEDMISPDHQTLPEVAKANGYRSFLIGGDPHLNFFSPAAGITRGVDVVDRHCLHSVGDQQRVRSALKAMRGGKFIGLVNTVRTHFPHFFIPANSAHHPEVSNYQGLLPTTQEEYEALAFDDWKELKRAIAERPETLARDELARQAHLRDEYWNIHTAKLYDGEKGEIHLRQIYDRAIRFADAFVGELFRALEEENLLEKTIVVLTADSGDNLFTQYHRPEGRSYDPSFGYAMVTPASARLPLMIFHPELDRRRAGLQHLTHLTNTTDLFPTVQALLGWKIAPAQALEGRHLLDPTPRRESLSFTSRPHRGLERAAHNAAGTYRSNPRRSIYFDAQRHLAWVDDELHELHDPNYLALREALEGAPGETGEMNLMRKKVGWARLD